jgi:RES domain-containing protein
MHLYRIVKSLARTSDLSGTGAYRVGGRRNSTGTYMLYTSENSSLAYLECLVHFDAVDFPPSLHIMQLEMDDSGPIYTLPDGHYLTGWNKVGFIGNRTIGDALMKSRSYLAVKVKSAVNEFEYNYLLNPLFPDYANLVKVKAVKEIKVDERFIPDMPGV